MSDQQQSPPDEHEPSEEGTHRRRGVYLLPNLFTTGALFSGFYAILASMNGQFTPPPSPFSFPCCWMDWMAACSYDQYPERVRRRVRLPGRYGLLWRGAGAGGVQLATVDLGKLGFFAAFVYAVGAALRLARFNTQIGSVDKRYFIGLPSPAAAAVVAGLVWTCTEYEIDLSGGDYLVALYLVLCGVLMVSNVLYYSFKDVDFKGQVPFWILTVIALVLGIISISTSTFLWLLFLLYALSGPLLWCWRRYKRRH